MTDTNIVFGKRKPPNVARKTLSNGQLLLKAKNKLFTGSERRKDLRRKTLKACKVVFNNRFSVFDGVMVNLSDTGAMIKVKNPAVVSNEFLLTTLYGGREHICAVKWRNDQFLGVQFEKF